MTASPVLYELRVGEDTARREPYLYLPFEPPPGTTRIDVTLWYEEGNIVDLGLLDSRAGHFPAREGFRGWSGGARSSFFVALDSATPGYIPGPIQPGTWAVILGLYRIRPEGCDIRVEASFDDSDRALVEEPPPHPRFRVQPGWYPGDLQSHTHHSDARGSLEDLTNAARGRGLRFLAVTDHNTVSHHRHTARLSTSELFLVPGEEVTTDAGHANVWGAAGWVDFRITCEGDVDRVVARAHELGGLVSINHPKPGGPPWRYPVPAAVDCVEAWQAPWPSENEASLAFYDALLGAGRRAVLVGGSDRHQPGWPDPDPVALQVGSPTTWLWLEELSVPAILAALRGGRVFVSESPAGPRLELSVAGEPMGGVLVLPAGDAASHEASDTALHANVRASSARPATLRLVGSTGELATAELGAGESETSLAFRPSAAGPFVRAELRDPEDGRAVALSNPVFLAGG